MDFYYYLIATILIITMLMIHKLQIHSESIKKSRYIVFGFSVLTLVVLLSLTKIYTLLASNNILPDILDIVGTDIKELTIHIFFCLLFYLSIIVLSILSTNVKMFHRIDVFQGVSYFLFILGFLAYSVKSKINDIKLRYILCLFILTVIIITITLTTRLKHIINFFNTENYGYICNIGTKFKDVSIEDSIICPNNKLY